jgi:hypothetical protein
MCGTQNHFRCPVAYRYMGVIEEMKPEYREGSEALDNFKRGMTALFKVPKSAVLPKNKQARKPARVRKKSDADKN